MLVYCLDDSWQRRHTQSILHHVLARRSKACRSLSVSNHSTYSTAAFTLVGSNCGAICEGSGPVPWRREQLNQLLTKQKVEDKSAYTRPENEFTASKVPYIEEYFDTLFQISNHPFHVSFIFLGRKKYVVNRQHPMEDFEKLLNILDCAG